MYKPPNRDLTLRFRVREEEMKKYEQGAERTKKRMSDFARTVLNRATEQDILVLIFPDLDK